MSVAPVVGVIGNLADHATEYARAGLEVFPVNPHDKAPLVSQYKATTDTEQVAAWWTQHPAALIGHRIAPDVIVIDIDPRHGGNDTWQALRTEIGRDNMPVTRAHLSGRGDGGGHIWWIRPDDKITITKIDAWAKDHGHGHQTGNGKWTGGIDLLHHNHRYTILPPSPHPETGRPYNWIGGHGLHTPPAPLPQLLVDLIVNDQPQEPPRPPRPPDPDSIADWWTDTHTWTELLERHGWRLVGGDGNNDRSRWRHPAATSACSATVRHGCLFVYTPNTPFDVTAPSDPHGYTLFRAWAVLEHGGRLDDAASAAREQKAGTNGRDDLAWVGATTATITTPGTSSDPPTPQADGRHIALTAAATIAPKRVHWCWQDRIAVGTIALLAGPEGLGKSTIAYWLAARITRGELPGEHHGNAKAVLVCATEDSWAHTIVPRLMAHGADLEAVYRTEVHDSDDDIDLGLSLPLDLAGLHDAAQQVDAALLVLDPLMSRLAANLDTHRDGEVRRALEPLGALAEHARLAILGLIHHNKSGSADPLQLVMASKAFTAVARSVHTVIRDPDDDTELRRLFGTSKNNLGRLDLPTLAFTIHPWVYDTDEGPGTTGQITWGEEIRESIADALARSSRDPEEKTALDEAAHWLEDYLSERQMCARAGDVITAGKAAGHAERTVQRARKKLGIEKSKSGFQGAWMWTLPNLPKMPTNPQDPEVGALAPLASPAPKDAKTNKGANSVSPRVREAPLTPPNIDPIRTCSRCGNDATDISGLCTGCLANPGNLPPINPEQTF